MSKTDQQPDEPQDETHVESHNEVHVETHTESVTSAGNGSTQEPDERDAKIAELTSDLQRLQAEFVNYRRRVESEKAEVVDYSKLKVVRGFLSTRDSFDHELNHRPKDVDAAWAKSIDAIRTQFDQVLTSLGVERFESKGQPFDPHLHDAVVMEEGDGDQEVVVEELQPGYKLGDTILRHAMVKVGRTK